MLVPVPRVERTMFAITIELKRKCLVLGESAIAVLGFHDVSRAEGREVFLFGRACRSSTFVPRLTGNGLLSCRYGLTMGFARQPNYLYTSKKYFDE